MIAPAPSKWVMCYIAFSGIAVAACARRSTALAASRLRVSELLGASFAATVCCSVWFGATTAPRAHGLLRMAAPH
jgi:hypothetical protein